MTDESVTVTINQAAKECGDNVNIARVQRVVKDRPDFYGLHDAQHKTRTGVRMAQFILRERLPDLRLELTEREQKRKQSGAKRSVAVAVADSVTIPAVQYRMMEKQMSDADDRIKEQSISLAEHIRTIAELREEVAALKAIAPMQESTQDARTDAQGEPGQDYATEYENADNPRPWWQFWKD